MQRADIIRPGEDLLTLPIQTKPRKYMLSIGFSRFCKKCKQETLQHFYLDYHSGTVAYSRCSHCHTQGTEKAQVAGWG